MAVAAKVGGKGTERCAKAPVVDGFDLCRENARVTVDDKSRERHVEPIEEFLVPRCEGRYPRLVDV